MALRCASRRRLRVDRNASRERPLRLSDRRFARSIDDNRVWSSGSKDWLAINNNDGFLFLVWHWDGSRPWLAWLSLCLCLSLCVIHWFVDISIRLCVLFEPTNKNLYHTSRLIGCGLDLDWLAGSWLHQLVLEQCGIGDGNY